MNNPTHTEVKTYTLTAKQIEAIARQAERGLKVEPMLQESDTKNLLCWVRAYSESKCTYEVFMCITPEGSTHT